MNKILISLFLFVSDISSVIGQDIDFIQTDRPDQTETPFVVPKKYLQMESGFSYEKFGDNIKTYTSPSLLTKFGLSDKFEVGVITEYVTIKSEENMQGFLPITVRFKQNITDEKGIIPVTSFIGYLSIPNAASSDFRSKYYAPGFRFTMQHTLSNKVTLGYNLGARWYGQTGEPVFLYTLTGGFTLSAKMGAYIELFGFAPQYSMSAHLFDGGFNYFISPDVLIDISGGAGYTENTLDYYAALGFSFRINTGSNNLTD
jgi:hypothetical protein